MDFENKYKSEHFIINYDSIDEDVAKRVINSLENNYQRILDFFKITDFKDITIVNIYPTRESYKELITQNNRVYQDWMIGSYWNGRINFISSNAIKDCPNIQESILNDIVHEFIHVVIHKLNNKVPRWLNEGLANCLSKNDITWYINSISNLIDEGKIPTLEELSIGDSIKFNDMKGYQFSMYYVDLIIKKYGNDMIIKLVKDYSYINEIDMKELLTNNKKML